MFWIERQFTAMYAASSYGDSIADGGLELKLKGHGKPFESGTILSHSCGIYYAYETSVRRHRKIFDRTLN